MIKMMINDGRCTDLHRSKQTMANCSAADSQQIVRNKADGRQVTTQIHIAHVDQHLNSLFVRSAMLKHVETIWNPTATLIECITTLGIFDLKNCSQNHSLLRSVWVSVPTKLLRLANSSWWPRSRVGKSSLHRRTSSRPWPHRNPVSFTSCKLATCFFRSHFHVQKWSKTIKKGCFRHVLLGSNNV